MKKNYIIVDSDNHWLSYSEGITLKEAKAELEEIEHHNTDNEGFREVDFYLFEVKEV